MISEVGLRSGMKAQRHRRGAFVQSLRNTLTCVQVTVRKPVRAAEQQKGKTYRGLEFSRVQTKMKTRLSQ